MAATKLSALTALLGTEVAAGDLLYVADVSANQSKKIALSEFGGKFLLDEITNASPGEFDFQNIPQQFNRLIIMGELRGDQAASAISTYCYFNNDRTATNYYVQLAAGSNGAASAGEAATPQFGTVAGASSVSNCYGGVQIIMENYAGSNLKRIRGGADVYRSGGAEASVYVSAMYHDSMVDAITRLTIAASNSPTNGLLGTLRLYGEF